MAASPPRRPTPARVTVLVAAAAAGAATRWLTDALIPMLIVVAAATVVIVLLSRAVRPTLTLAVTVLASLVVQLPTVDPLFTTPGLLAGLMVALVIAVPLGIRRVVDQRRAYQRRGWQLAALESRRRADETALALQRERMTLAAEMHDGLGHSLTLVAVRLGQLSLSPSLAEDDRDQVRAVRRLAADAADELGSAVRLLRRPGDLGATWTSPDVTEAVEGARAAGVTVALELDPEVGDALSDEAATAVGRVVQEALTNAAKHAPSAPVDVAVELDGDDVVARISNPLAGIGADGTATAHAHAHAREHGGFGLDGLRHRATVLGGELTVERSDDDFTVRLRLPARAHPLPDPRPDELRPDELRAAESSAADDRSRAVRLAVALPAAIVAAAVFVVLAHFTLTTTLSVMSAGDLAAVTVGQPQAEAERGLPSMQILDPPRQEFPARPGEECRYYESAITPFERTDVYVVCFAGERVSRTGMVPAR